MGRREWGDAVRRGKGEGQNGRRWGTCLEREHTPMARNRLVGLLGDRGSGRLDSTGGALLLVSRLVEGDEEEQVRRCEKSGTRVRTRPRRHERVTSEWGETH